MSTLQYASAFTGIGGFEVAFERHGMRATVHIEKDRSKHPVLKEHWADTPLMEDICDVSGTDLGRIEMLVGGFPCKDISRGAPYRQGLAGRHSSKLYELLRLVDEYARLVDATNPRWVVLENSVDLLGRWNGGRDLTTIVRTLEELGYGWAFRVVDARGFGTPQRRRRILLVGHRGGDPRPAGQVLALLGGRDEDAPPSDGGRPEPRPGPGPIAAGGDLVRVWRKGANSQVKIGLPGFRETWVNDGRGNTLTPYDAPSPTRQKHLIAQHGGVRALSPIEWERLMGFPDNWTAPASYSARFKALGDAVHVGVANWLGERLVAVHQALPQIA